MPRYRVRRVSPEDPAAVERIAVLHRKTMCGAPFPLLEGQWWLVFYGKEIVAFAGMRGAYSEQDAGYLCRAGVLPAHRGQGLQRRLIRVRERAARKKGWRVMLADTTGSPESAHNLAKCGYQPFTPANPWFRKETIYWRRSLTK